MAEPRPVRMADPAALLAPHRPALEAALGRVVASGRFVLGPELEAFEAELAARYGVRAAIGVSSGTDALTLALEALGVGPGDLVLTTPFSFVSTAAVIVARGATPVFVDIEENSFGLDPDAARAWAESDPARAGRVKAILPVHLFGGCADLSSLTALAEQLGAPLVEDAAQAIDASDDAGRRAGAAGAVGCLSFYPTKNLGGLGDGGMVLTDDPALAHRLSALRSPRAPQAGLPAGLNRRLPDLSAAALRTLLPHLEAWTQARRRAADAYDPAVRAAGLVPPSRGPGHVVHQYVVRAPEGRDALCAHLAARGIETAVYYPEPLHRQGDFPRLSIVAGPLERAERTCREVLALPVHPALDDDDRAHVVRALEAWAR